MALRVVRRSAATSSIVSSSGTGEDAEGAVRAGPAGGEHAAVKVEAPARVQTAAVVLSETHAFAPYHQALTHGSDLRILRGKRWSTLPRTLQHRWEVPCRCCGVPHDRFDLVTLANDVIASAPASVKVRREG